MSIELVNNTGYVKKGVASFFNYTQSNINLGANTAIPIFEVTEYNDSSSISVLSTTQIKLLAGRKYKLRGSINVLMSGSTQIDYKFYNVTAGAYVGIPGVGAAPTDTSAFVFNTTAELIITPNVDTVISLYTRTATLQTLYGNSQVIVEELEAYLPAVTGTQYASILRGNGPAGCAILGKTDGVAPSAGYIGETLSISGTISATTASWVSSGTAVVTLPAGVWAVFAAFETASGPTRIDTFLSANNANDPTSILTRTSFVYLAGNGANAAYPALIKATATPYAIYAKGISSGANVTIYVSGYAVRIA